LRCLNRDAAKRRGQAGTLLSILYLRCDVNVLRAFAELYSFSLSILYLRCQANPRRSGRGGGGAFNSLFEMPYRKAAESLRGVIFGFQFSI